MELILENYGKNLYAKFVKVAIYVVIKSSTPVKISAISTKSSIHNNVNTISNVPSVKPFLVSDGNVIRNETDFRCKNKGKHN